MPPRPSAPCHPRGGLRPCCRGKPGYASPCRSGVCVCRGVGTRAPRPRFAPSRVLAAAPPSWAAAATHRPPPHPPPRPHTPGRRGAARPGPTAPLARSRRLGLSQAGPVQPPPVASAVAAREAPARRRSRPFPAAPGGSACGNGGRWQPGGPGTATPGRAGAAALSSARLPLTAGSGVSCGGASLSSRVRLGAGGSPVRRTGAGGRRELGLFPLTLIAARRGFPQLRVERRWDLPKGERAGSWAGLPGANRSCLFPGLWGWGGLKRRRRERLLESEEMLLALLRWMLGKKKRQTAERRKWRKGPAMEGGRRWAALGPRGFERCGLLVAVLVYCWHCSSPLWSILSGCTVTPFPTLSYFPKFATKRLCCFLHQVVLGV